MAGDKHIDRWDWCDVTKCYVNYPDGNYVLHSDYAALERDRDRLREALEEIADTDPDDGTSWFHDKARAALAGRS